MSAAKTGTPMADSCSARTWRVTVLPVPVAPAIRPWRFIIAAGIWTTASGWVVPSSTPRPRPTTGALGGVGRGDAGGEVGGLGLVGHGRGS